MINRGELFVLSDYLLSKLLVMRHVFKGVHHEGLKKGKDCIKTLAFEMQCAVGDVIPADVIYFFAKISVFFKMRHLNNIIAIYV